MSALIFAFTAVRTQFLTHPRLSVEHKSNITSEDPDSKFGDVFGSILSAKEGFRKRIWAF
jgi:hypothetical protein